MSEVCIIGLGMTRVGEHWARSIVELAEEAASLALEDAGRSAVDALILGNAYGGVYNQQTQLGALVAAQLRLHGVEAFTCEAGEAAGGVALRAGYLAVKSGAVQSALVIGVEKATDIVGAARVGARAASLDAEYEALQGASLTAMAGILMRRYMHEYGRALEDFAGFSVNAHRNGTKNPLAMYRNRLREGAFAKAPMLAEPVSLFDSAPDADGAAAVLLAASEHADDSARRPVEIRGSAAASDTLALQDRANPLHLKSAAKSTAAALKQAGIARDALDLLELHDAYTILTALSLEAMGFSAAGQGSAWAADGGERIALRGALPISTFGGLKSRGNPSGAAGIYQAAEAALQLRGAAGGNQVPNARTALIQSIGGLGATTVTHILSASA